MDKIQRFLFPGKARSSNRFPMFFRHRIAGVTRIPASPALTAFLLVTVHDPAAKATLELLPGTANQTNDRPRSDAPAQILPVLDGVARRLFPSRMRLNSVAEMERWVVSFGTSRSEERPVG